MLSIFLCYAPQDESFARELAQFLEAGCDCEVSLDGRLTADEGLIPMVHRALQADVAVAIFSPDSMPERWVREEWEPAFQKEPEELHVPVVKVLARECNAPAVLRRENYFDATGDRLAAFRKLKRWLISQRPIPEPLPFRAAPGAAGRAREIELLRAAISDAPGTAVLANAKPASGKTALALAFAYNAAEEFAGVAWAYCGRRSLAGIAGDLAAQLGLLLPNQAGENAATIAGFCAQRRVLLVLDDLRDSEALALAPGGRASTIITTRRTDVPAQAIPFEPFAYEPMLVPGHVRDLLIALCACAPGSSSATLASEMADGSLDELIERDLACPLTDDKSLVYIPTPVLERIDVPATVRRHHAALAARKPASLPEIRHALDWALAQNDEHAWSLACDLARKGAWLAREKERVAEAFEFTSALFDGAQVRGDRRLLDEFAREKVWILEQWERGDEARALESVRRADYVDQMSFEFV